MASRADASTDASEASLRTTSVFRLSGWGVLAIAGWYLFVQSFIALESLDQVRSAWPVVAAIALMFAATALLIVVQRGPLSVPIALVVVAVIVVMTVLVEFNVTVEDPVYGVWNFGATVLLAILLALRGRLGLAWIGYGLVALVTVAWIIAGNRSWSLLVTYLAPPFSLLAIVTLFVISLAGVDRAMARLHAVRVGIARRTAESRIAYTEQTTQAMVLDDLAGAALARLASGAPITPVDRERYAQLEAAVRDRLRARSLLTPAIVAAAQSARDRGVDVVLLDDRGDLDLPASVIAQVESAVTSATAESDAERVTARLLPAGRNVVATVVVASAHDSHGVRVPRA